MRWEGRGGDSLKPGLLGGVCKPRKMKTCPSIKPDRHNPDAGLALGSDTTKNSLPNHEGAEALGPQKGRLCNLVYYKAE